MKWAPLSDFRIFLKDTLKMNNIPNVFFQFKNVVNQLQAAFPTPDAWLEVPPEQRPSFRYLERKEVWYIIFWAWTTGHCEGETDLARSRRKDMVLYLASRGRVNLAIFPEMLGLLSSEEIQFIKNIENGKGILNKLAIHMMGVLKPLREFTAEDVELADVMRPNDRRYNGMFLKGILFSLGYSDNPGKRRQKKMINDCIEHPKWSSIAQEYYHHLNRCMTLDYYVRKCGSALLKFFNWLEIRGLPDASNLEYEDYLDLFEYFSKNDNGEKYSLKYQGNRLSFIKAFLEWGIGFHSFFPQHLDWPMEIYLGIHRKGMSETYSGNGLAFDDSDFPLQMQKAIHSYIPKDDVEALCRAFWLIIASSPIRKTFLLNLQAQDCVLPMPNAPEAFGLYSPYSGNEKAKHKNGQFPILDITGLEALRFLQERVNALQLRPMWNEKANASYVHLFQFPEYPWLLTEPQLYGFFDKVAESIGAMKGKAHGFRHYLITHIAVETGNSQLARLAGGHVNDTMTQRYLRSNLSRTALLFAVIKKYQQGELAGRYIFRIFEALANDQTEPNEMIRALASDEVTMDAFFSRFGLPAPTGVGRCLVQRACENEAKCFSCHHFVIRKEEVSQAFQILTNLTKHMWFMMQVSHEFTRKNSKAAGLITQIALLSDMIRHFGFTEEEIQKQLLLNLSI